MKYKIETMQYTISPTGIKNIYVLGEDKNDNEFELDITTDEDQACTVNFNSVINKVKISKKYRVPKKYYIYGTLQDYLDEKGTHVIYNHETKADNITVNDNDTYTVSFPNLYNITVTIENSKNIIYFLKANRFEIFDDWTKKIEKVFYVGENGLMVRNYTEDKVDYVRFSNKEGGTPVTYEMTTVGTISNSVVNDSINIGQRSIFYLLKQSIKDNELYEYDKNEVYPVLVDLFNPDNSFIGTCYSISREKDNKDDNTEIITIDFKYHDKEVFMGSKEDAEKKNDEFEEF